jgi:hypothetical protein
MLSNEELEVLLGMGDISSAEEAAQMQLALAQQLRNSPLASKGRNDIGSNIGRAGAGIGAAMSNYKGLQQQETIAPMRKQFMDQMSEALRKKRDQAVATGGVPDYMPSVSPDL